jgi:outer membrane protein OmpA-like peptidoglycan-associated protein
MIRPRIPIFLLSGAALLAVTACTEPGYVTGQDQNRKTKQGAVIGGLLGAATGAAVSDSKGKGALLGGAIGALGGAAIGNALDKQEAELRQQLDSDGAASYNQRLSERRANAVADVLMDGGVRGARIRAFGRGEDQPIASNLSPEGKRQNRRVEIVILPNA